MLFLNRFPVCFNFFVLLFLLTPCLVVAIQPCMEWIPILKKSSLFCDICPEKLMLFINPILDGHFWSCSRIWGGGKKAPLPKICHTYPIMMKLGTVIPYLKKIKKIHESRDTPPDFCWHQHFFTKNQQILLYQEIQI